MAGQGRPTLGIDINQAEISVVEIRGTWPDSKITRFGRTPTPPGAVEAGRIADPGAIASALRSLLEENGFSTRDAVIGLPECCVVTRVLDIPAVPLSEMRTVIEGELAHYQILGNSAGAFDFMLLARREGEAETGPQALVMAAEQVVVAGYRAVAEMAGLTLVAMEPALLAAYRAAFPTIYTQPVGACLAIGRNESEITITCKGQIRLYRRIDIGRDNLILETSVSKNAAPRGKQGNARVPFGEIAEDAEEEGEPDAQPSEARALNPSAARSLTVELQRSLDYYASQNPDESEISRLVVATSAPELAPLLGWFSQAISIETVPAGPPTAPVAVTDSNGDDLTHCLCAAGLAMREMTGLPAAMPRFDLSSQQRNTVVLKSVQRRLSFALGGSIAAILLGSLLAFQIGLRANHCDHELGHLKEDLAGQERIRQAYIASIQTRQDLLRTLRTQGFPFPRIMDSVSGALAQEAGFTSVSLDGGGRLTVNGDANNEKEVIKTLENLRKVPYFESVSMDMFDKQSPTQTSGWLVRFQISCQLTSARRTAFASSSTRQGR